MIGLTIVAFGTSAPEMVVSAGAALDGAPDLGVGNAIGSNIANIGLVLGVTAFIARIPISKQLITLEIPLLLLSTFLAIFCLWDLHLGFIDGVILMSCAISLPLIFYIKTKRNRNALESRDFTTLPVHQDTNEEQPSNSEEEFDITQTKAATSLIFGLFILLFSSNILVSSATDIAQHFGVSGLIIGLTIVALGTSLPELAASIASALKGHHDIAIGNVIGSNVLNIFAVMALPGLIMPTALDGSVLFRDIGVMTAMTLLLTALVIFCSRKPSTAASDKESVAGVPSATAKTASFGPAVGSLLLLCYIGYYVIIFVTVQ